jgi:CheY-like chemotaxis protein
MIAGFYDKGNGGAEATRELKQAAGIPGIVGMMYTTYNDDYSQLQNFAAAAKAGWPGYLASLKGK